MISALNLQQLKKNQQVLKRLSAAQKNQVLQKLAQFIKEHSAQLLLANQKDVQAFQKSEAFSAALLDRLTLNEKRIEAMITGLTHVADLAEVVGVTVQKKTLANGLILNQVTDPFGVILFIFEARPNVITEAFSLAWKSSNVILMKAGKEAKHSAEFLFSLIRKALTGAGLQEDFFVGFSDLSREQTDWLMLQNREIDLLIPRGGEKLIEHVKKHSKIPVIQNDRGLCHLYIEADADLAMALAILENAKMQRPGVCNSLETLLVHQSLASQFLPKAFSQLSESMSKIRSKSGSPSTSDSEFTWYACTESRKWLPKDPSVQAAQKDSFDQEYLDFKINCKVVQNLDEAIAHINAHGSKHSESIITKSTEHAKRFQSEVDAAVVYWNASTRFTDGMEFGLGGEIGISTQKLHVRGPVGLQALTTLKWVVDGTGQVR
jgi:glutamate-5-semialdehyde dehydrogenase